MEIAVYLDKDRNILYTNNTNNLAAEKQANEEGWILIQNSDPAFSINEMYKWTVRESDGLLVHKSTGKTPDEEAKALLSELTKSQLKSQMASDQVQQAITAVTKQAIQDKLTSQMVTMGLIKQVADLTAKLNKISGVDSAPEAPTDVTSTATNDGAVITAK